MNKIKYVAVGLIACFYCWQPCNAQDSINLKAVKHAQKGEFDKAAELFMQSYEMAVEQGNDSLIARVSSNLGNVFTYIKDYNKAKKYYGISLEKARWLQDSRGIAGTYSNLAVMYEYMKDFTRSIEYNTKALQINEQIGDSARVSISLNNIGTVYGRMKEQEKALEYYLKALPIQEALGDKYKLGYTYSNIGDCHKNLGKGEKALPYFEQARIIAEKHGYMDMKRFAYSGLSKAYRLTGEHDSAWKYQELWVAVKDSLYNERITGQIQEVEAKYQAEKKDREIAELEKKEAVAVAIAERRQLWLLVIGCLLLGGVVAGFFYIRQRKAKEKQRRAELEQKALRAQMNPHFIFNSLNAIQDMYTSGETDLANDYMGDFGELMRKILDNSGKDKITVKEEVDTLRLYLELEKARSGELLEYTIEVDEKIDQLNTYMPPLVIQPFVENAIWHGVLPKKEKGNVGVRIQKTEDGLVCVVEDDGVGIEPPPVRQGGLSPSKGGQATHEPKGMKLTEQRLGIPVKIEKLQPGTRVTIMIPIKPHP